MKAKKSLGQNFLKSTLILNQVAKAGDIKSDDTILEIGPGKGALTKILLEKAKKVIAVEKDNVLIELLKEKFKNQIESGSFILLHEDILNFSPEKFNLASGSYKVVANIPYNITGAILKKFLSTKQQPQTMVLMVQHEVAKRIIARDGKESILSISVKAYGKPKMVLKVGAQYFSPKPKVNSAIIAITHISKDVFRKNKINEERFWQIVHTGFAHKRKKLIGNFKKITYLNKDLMTILGNKRAENLSLEDWILLSSS